MCRGQIQSPVKCPSDQSTCRGVPQLSQGVSDGGGARSGKKTTEIIKVLNKVDRNSKQRHSARVGVAIIYGRKSDQRIVE